MKAVLAILMVCTLIGSGTGYWIGRETTSYPIVQTLINSTEVVLRDNKYSLDYVCDGKTYFSYDVDTKQRISGELSLKEILQLSRDYRRERNQTYYERGADIVAAFVTGGGAVRFAGPLLKIIRGEQAKRWTIPSMIGGLSGYYLGYGIATRLVPSCHDPFAIDFAQSTAIWKSLEANIASRYVLQAMGRDVISGLNDKKAESSIAAAQQQIREGKIDSQTFALIASVAAYDASPEPSGWVTFEMIFAVYFPAAILLLLAIGAAVALAGAVAEAASKRASRNEKARATRDAKALEAKQQSELLEENERLRDALRRSKDTGVESV